MTALYLIILFFMFLVCGAWVVVEISQRNARRAKEYDELYKEIQDDFKRPADSHLENIIKYKLEKLKSLKHKDKEKTQVLQTELCRVFHEIDEDEFSPESVFRK